MDALKPLGDARRRRTWLPSALLGAGSFALLLAFHHTVAQAVHHAALRRHADTQLALAAWQCNTLQSPGDRRGCLGRLGVRETGPSAGCDAVTPDGSACAFSGVRRAGRPATARAATL